MIIFRPHRALLADSMAEAKEFNNVEEMKEYIVNFWHKNLPISKKLFTADDIIIDETSAINDTRIGWEDSMYVCVKRMGHENCRFPQCVGMCAKKYKKLN